MQELRSSTLATECTQTECSECDSTALMSAISFAYPGHKYINCEGTLEPKGHNETTALECSDAAIAVARPTTAI